MSRVRISQIEERVLHNIDKILELSGNKKVIWVVKNNAYGHNVDKITNLLLSKKQRFFGLYSLEETRELDKTINNAELFVLDGFTESEWSSFTDNNSFRNKINIVLNKLQDLDKISVINNENINYHVFVETGFHWYGVDDIDQFFKIAQIKGVKISGICTHLADAENPQSELSLVQIKRFNDAVGKAKIFNPQIEAHISNSSGLISQVGFEYGMARAGRILYGGIKGNSDYEQVIKIEAEIMQIKNIKIGDFVGYGGTFLAEKDMKIAILAMGYKDGIDRRCSNNGIFLVKDKFCPIIGKVAMNITVIDVSEVEEIKEGDWAVFSDDIDGIKLSDIAERIGGLDYEIMTRLGNG